MKKNRYQAAARQFKSKQHIEDISFSQEQYSEDESTERPRLKRPRYSRFNDSEDGSGRRHKLRFTERRQCLHYTAAEERSSPLLLEGDIGEEIFTQKSDLPLEKSSSGTGVNKHRSFYSKRNQIAQTVDESLDQLAEQSDNEGIKMGNIHRKNVGEGVASGFRKGRRWRSGHDARAKKREIRRDSKRKIRDTKELAYEQRHGKPPLKARARKKLQQKRQQMRKAAEQKLGKEAVNTIEALVRLAVRAIAAAVRAIVAFVIAPLAGVVGVYGMVLIMAMLIGGALLTISTTTLSAYTAEPNAIEQASCHYTKLEAQLEKKIKDIPMSWEWGHIDEFRYDLDPIGHDAYQIMAYLNVKYPDFNLEDPLIWQQVQTEIDYIFDARYELILDEEIEIRTYESTSTDEFGNETSTTIEYPYYILNVILHSKEQEPLLLTELNRNPEEELVEWYGVLQETQGARQDYANPFGIYDWRGSVSNLYGWRIDPIGGRELQMHHGLDIAMPRGTPIFAGLDGFVDYTGFDPIMGNFIAISDNKGRTIKYGHCDGISVSDGQAVVAGSSVIGTVGNSGQSTGAHLHVEILENGGYLDPIYSLNYTMER